MKAFIIGLFLIFVGTIVTFAQQNVKYSLKQEKIINLSKQKWQWMAEKNVDLLEKLFDDKSMFIHMGGTWGKSEELTTTLSGNICYKKVEIYNVTINIFGNTAILLNDIDLIAVVGGNEVINPFMETEVYVKTKGKWKMASLTFSRLVRPVKYNNNPITD